MSDFGFSFCDPIPFGGWEPGTNVPPPRGGSSLGGGSGGLGGFGFTGCITPPPPSFGLTGGDSPIVPSLGCVTPGSTDRQCFAKLRARPGNFGWWALIYHAWWYVKGSEGKGIISGDGSRQPGYLNAYYSAGTRSTVNADSRTAGWLVWDSGESSVHCERVDRMVRAAKTFPNGTVIYGIAGPNSNSIAGCMGAVGGFHPRINSWLYAGFNQPVGAGDCPPGY